MISHTFIRKQLKGQVVKSIIEFETDNACELFILFSPGATNGPPISRTGKGSPTMVNRIQPFSDPTPDPDLQRYGNPVIDDQIRQKDLKNLQNKIEENFIKDHYANLKRQTTYSEIFNKSYGDEYKIVAMQGFGDLTMNLWNVGYVNDKNTGKPEILHLFDEPIDRRTYSCLVKWKDPVKYTIQNLRFDRYEFNSKKTSSNVVISEDGEGIADQIEFAIFGQQLVKNNYLVPDLEDQIHQYADIRHVFQLPNINPRDKLNKEDQGYPRTYFGTKQYADVWFGEEQLLSSRNLRKAALRGSIELELDRPGVSIEILRSALEKSGYKEISHGKRLITRHKLNEGNCQTSEWKILEDNPNRIEILLKENIYPCTMIGVQKDRGVALLAWKGTYSQRPGWTLREAAECINEQGTTDAILCDEGADVFQYLDHRGSLNCIIPPGRSQHRAVLVVAEKIKRKNSTTKSLTQTVKS